MELWKEQHQAQENMVKGLCEALREQPGTSTAWPTQAAVHYRLSKLMNDDVEAFLCVFGATDLAAGWPWPQWVTILGPYLTGPAQ